LKLTKPSGFIYISSVIKKPWAVYKYRNKGKFVLDPTHEREYKDKEEFSSLFSGLKIINLNVFPVSRKLGFLELKIPGYCIIEILAKKEQP
jgi:hypothetical protein